MNEVNYLEVLAENIKRLRGRMTQRDLAKKARIGKSTISAGNIWIGLGHPNRPRQREKSRD